MVSNALTHVTRQRSCNHISYNYRVLSRNLRPMRLSRRAGPFDSDDYIFELKIDGFRALAHIQAGQSELISRNGHTFHGFAELPTWIAEHLRVESAILDGEIACLDESGRPTFRDLILMLKRLIRRKRARMFYLDHVESDGRLLFEEVVKMDWKVSSVSKRIHRTR
jgi:ATP-dependent DNA ligase